MKTFLVLLAIGFYLTGCVSDSTNLNKNNALTLDSTVIISNPYPDTSYVLEYLGMKISRNGETKHQEDEATGKVKLFKNEIWLYKEKQAEKFFIKSLSNVCSTNKCNFF